MKSRILLSLALPCTLLFLAGIRGLADDHDKKTDVTITAPIEVPGGIVLQPGTYMFKLLNATANRHVVQISSEDGKKTFALIMTAAASRTERTDNTVLTFYEMPNDSPQAVRKWFWPGDFDGQEFLYPHKRAVQISQLTKQTVSEAPEDQSAGLITPADANPAPAAPAQDSLVASAAAITTTPVTTEAPAPESAAAVPAPEPQLLAQASPATPAPTATDQSSPENSIAQNSNAQNTNDNSTLPQTASDLPLITLIGCMAMAAALVIRGLRRV
jgi:hypothetical protein